VVHEQGVTVTRSISRIVPLALVLVATAAPAAQAQAGTAAEHQRPAQVGDPGFLDYRPAEPAGADLVSPDARDSGRRETAAAPLPGPPTWPVDPKPLDAPASPAVAADGFDWFDAGIGAAGIAALMVALGGVAVTVRMRRRPNPQAGV
jgi:hypothetical protein